MLEMFDFIYLINFFPLKYSKYNQKFNQVVYDATLFLDKNKDLLFKDLMYAMGSSKNFVLRFIFLFYFFFF